MHQHHECLDRKQRIHDESYRLKFVLTTLCLGTCRKFMYAKKKNIVAILCSPAKKKKKRKKVNANNRYTEKSLEFSIKKRKIFI